MQQQPVAIHVAAVSDTGRVRRNNEDAIGFGRVFFRSGVRSARFEQADSAPLLLSIGDGVGGSAAGEVASRYVVERMAALLARVDPAASPESMEVLLKRTADEVNRELLAEARRRSGRSGMATTYTGLLFAPAGYWLNAGDSRLYALRGGRLEQVSRDHTLREETGDPTIPGNIITNCFGTAERFYLDVGPLDAASSDAYLLCSDGLSDYADMNRVADVLAAVGDRESRDLPHLPPDDAAVSLEHAAGAALQLALEAGGGDNVTLLVARPVYE